MQNSLLKIITNKIDSSNPCKSINQNQGLWLSGSYPNHLENVFLKATQTEENKKKIEEMNI